MALYSIFLITSVTVYMVSSVFLLSVCTCSTRPTVYRPTMLDQEITACSSRYVNSLAILKRRVDTLCQILWYAKIMRWWTRIGNCPWKTSSLNLWEENREKWRQGELPVHAHRRGEGGGDGGIGGRWAEEEEALSNCKENRRKAQEQM